MFMSQKRSSLKPWEGGNRSLRRRLDLNGELVLALLPTVTVLTVFSLVGVLTRQRLLFASLAVSAFLIYLDPQHGTNTIRTLTISQMLAAKIGWVTYLVFGAGYVATGSAMVIAIVLIILLDAMYPPRSRLH